jgi:solute carrier family 25 carnitine/acylcarnitine transporter 20/29
MEYDAFRSLLGRSASGEQGRTPNWLPVHPSLVPFLCGSVAGVSSWALIYPLDVSVSSSVCIKDNADARHYRVKTKVQQRALAHDIYRGPFETLYRLIRGHYARVLMWRHS